MNQNAFILASDIAAGRLKYTPAANGNGSPYDSFTFQVKDDGGTSGGGIDLDGTARLMTLNVTPVNDPPVGVTSTVSTNEDTAVTLHTTDFASGTLTTFDPTDAPASNSLANVLIASLPPASLGTLLLNGNPVTTGSTISAAAIAGNGLRFVPASNANGSGTVTFRVQDDGGILNGGVDTSSEPVHAHAQRGQRERRSARDQQGRRDQRRHGLHGQLGRLRLQRPERQPGQQLPLGQGLVAARQRHAVVHGEGPITPAMVTAGFFVLKTDIDAGKLIFTPGYERQRLEPGPLHVPGEGRRRHAPSGADLDPTAKTLSISVTAVNDAPTGTDKPVTTREDVAYVFHRGLRLRRCERRAQ